MSLVTNLLTLLVIISNEMTILKTYATCNSISGFETINNIKVSSYLIENI